MIRICIKEVTDIVTIINKNEKILAYLNNIQSGKLIEEINGEFTLTFTALIDPIKTDFLYNKDNLLSYKDDYFRVAFLEELHNESNMLVVNVYAEHISYDLIKNTTENFVYKDKAWIVNTKLDRFYKVMLFKLLRA